jgi:hypothetical protein
MTRPDPASAFIRMGRRRAGPPLCVGNHVKGAKLVCFGSLRHTPLLLTVTFRRNR